MRTIRVDLSGASVGKVLDIGSAGENLATRVIFDAAKWREAYPDGVLTLIVQRSDGAAYPANVTVDGGNAVWTPTSVDTVAGSGHIELTLTNGDTIVKSAVLNTYVAPSLSATTTPPPESASWVAQVLEAAESVREGATVSPMTGATNSTAGAAGLVPAPAAGDESKVLIGNGEWIDPSDIRTEETVLCKTFTSATPPTSMAQSGFRGMVTRIKNPGKFTKIRATVLFKSMTVNSADSPYGELQVGIMSGDTDLSVQMYADSQPYLATGEYVLTEEDTFLTVDIELDSAVDVADEYLYVWLWNTDGSGKWMSGGINTNVVSPTTDHKNYFLGRFGATSTRCYTTDTSDAMDNAAAFQIIARQNPTEIALTSLDQRLDALEAKSEETIDDTNPLAVLRPDGGDCNIFNSITCIGDSLTAGVHERNDSGEKEYPQCPNYSYPAFMARVLGITVTKQANGGATAKSHLTNGVFTPAAVTDAYIIALGTNDISMATGTNISGAITDINTTDMTQTDTTTDVGAYGKIIQCIKTAVPKAKIFIVTIPHTRNSDSQIAYSNALYKQVAALLDCYVIDLETYGVQSNEEVAWKAIWYLGGHLNTMGYRQLAVWIMSYIDWIIRHNMDDFKQTAFIQTNYSYSNTPLIVVSSQPLDLSAVVGAINQSLSVTATASNGGIIAYQWYSNTTDSNTGGMAIDGAINASMALDTALPVGNHYYYCVLTLTGAASVTTNCVTVTVSYAETEPIYLANYVLTGTPNAEAPATIADTSGNGNTLTVNNITAYDANGYLISDVNNQSLSMATVNLSGKTKYKMHFTLGKYSGSSQNRIFALGSVDLSLQLGDVCLQVESSATLGFTSPLQTTNYKVDGGITSRLSVFKYEFDWFVDGDSITIDCTLYGTSSMTPYSATTTFTCTGFTEALTTGGIYICNRADGTRPAHAPLHDFYIQDLT